MNTMKEKERRRRLARLTNPRHRDRLLDSLNRSTLHEGAARVGGGDKEFKILTETNELQEFENNNWSRGTL